MAESLWGRGSWGRAVLALSVSGTAHMMWLCGSVTYRLSEWYRANYASAPPFRSGLHPSSGWWDALGIPALVDLKDAQYHGFRDGLHLLVLALGGFCFTSRMIWHCSSADARRRGAGRLFGAISGVLMLFALHGGDAGYMLLLAWLNYGLSELAVNSRVEIRVTAIAITWALSCGAVVLAARYGGWGQFPWARLPIVGVAVAPLELIDGIVDLPWHHRLPLTVLRLISFSLDRAWASDIIRARRMGEPAVADHGLRRRNNAKAVSADSLETPDPALPPGPDSPLWGWVAYLAYVFYPPLYLAGPIITFNAWAASVTNPSTPSARQKVHCIIGAVSSLVAYELFLRVFSVGAIAQSPRALQEVAANPVTAAVFGYAGVNFLYLKFLSLWRFFRAWAVLDNIIPPDNMPVCITMTDSIRGFWRGWHASFNKWLVRYIYIPLGGRSSSRTAIIAVSRRAFNIAIVFTFVAVWHDQSLSLMAWSWIIIAAIVPELLATQAIHGTQVGKVMTQASWFIHVEAAGAVYAMGCLIAANIVGFSAGADAGLELIYAVLSSPSTLVSATLHLLALAHVNREIRLFQKSMT